MSVFSNKVVVITGGSEGIGKSLVEEFLLLGAKVATCSRNYDKLYQLQTLFPDKPLFIYAADVSSEQECKSFILASAEAFGSIDILINNAGVSMRALFMDTELETLKKLMDVNFWGTVYCTKYAMPYILQKKGAVVGISSVAGYRGLPGRTGYSASKHALNGFLEALKTELLDSGVHVMWVCPGFTASNIRKVALNKNAKPEAESLMDETKMMSVKECALNIINALKKKKRTITLTFQGKQAVFMNRFFPSWTDKLVKKFYFRNGELIQ
ncbi:MAG: SDR family oxidoreductase [Chitinophagaceae bacterium]|jgi:short-subunit dehydrogenase|nr:SDR family oxidoreductase [Chitinophagaceae bacterium]